ncbi:MAG: spore coat associated protein CotJA [Lachnospiraceae bacterium]|nr:spore coat associated protein CotJA [Lachnospiraceae bacterium]
MRDYLYREPIDEFPVAMAYVPWQRFKGICENLEKGYLDGTIFPELNKPFTGRRCCKG